MNLEIEQFKQTESAFHRALDTAVGPQDERLRDLCGGDETLRAEVGSLLEAWQQMTAFEKNRKPVAL